MTFPVAYEPDHMSLQHAVRFVLARLDDDHRTLRALRKRGAAIGAGSWDEHRLEVDLEARREIVGLLQRMAVLRDLPAEAPVREHARRIVELLALPYREHRAYDETWLPESA